MSQKKAAGQLGYFHVNIIIAQKSCICSAIVATHVPDGTPA
jgi:hypothetical protein